MAVSQMLPLFIGKEEYARLDALARDQDRTAVQQARWMLRQALAAVAPPEHRPQPTLAGDAAAE